MKGGGLNITTAKAIDHVYGYAVGIDLTRRDLQQAERQKGDLTELIWNVPEIIWKLSQQVEIGAGDIIMTGTPAGVAAISPGDKIECGVDGVGTLKVAIGKAVG